jgi:hypothetical protein
MVEAIFQIDNAELKFPCHSDTVRLKYCTVGHSVEQNNDCRVSRLLVQLTYFGLSSDANLDARQTKGRQRP